tara:strand:+ start:664 stop:1584 length:921 start_codon:yes stop_codon:yes gene_type:complete
LAPHSGRKDFWEGVLTRSQLAGQMKEHNKIKKELVEKKDELKKIKDNSDICVICQEQCLEKAENSTPCGHVFHTGCLLGWLKSNNTCPCCRAPLYDKPEIPEQEHIEGIVELAIRRYLDVEPTQAEDVSISPAMLYNVGDDIGRLVAEDVLDLDLDWFIDNHVDDDDEDDNDETATVVTEELDTNVEGLDAEDIEALLQEPEDGDVEQTMTFADAIHEGYWEVNQEEKMPEQSPVLTPDTPDLFVEFHWREPQSMMDSETTQFTEWFRFGGVLQELRSRNSFMQAWNNIEAEHRTRTPTPSHSIRV